jgi:arylsulfatase A-like enzyme
MSKGRPNVVLFFTDQQRLSGLGCYGDTPCRTPNIDRMASEGVRFETAYTSCPLCTPARASLMTGLHVHGHGMLSNMFEYGACMGQLPDGPHLLPRRLAAAGYRCGYVGKWHLGNERTEWFGAKVDPSLPRTRGFEGVAYTHQEYLDRHHLTYEPKATTELCRCSRYAGPPEASISHWLTDQTLMLVDRFVGDEEPFFIMHSDPGPHAGYTAPQELYDLYSDADIPPWPNYVWDSCGIDGPHQVKIHPQKESYSWEDWAEVLRHYYARCTLIDMQVGRLRDALAERGLLENTLIIFASDHGETLGSHGGLIDKGWHHFEETHRIGLVAQGPMVAKPGRVATQFASLLDVHPTILDAAGADYDADALHGASLVPLLEGREVPWRDEVFVEFFGLTNTPATLLTCRCGDLKYGWNCTQRDELYDLSKDPHEMDNRIADPAYADRLADLRQRTAAFMERTGHKSLGTFRSTRLNEHPRG